MAVRRVGTDDECRREEESMVLAAERGSARRKEPSSEWPVTSEERTVSQPAPLAVLMAAFRDGDAGAFEDVHAQVFALCYHRARRLGASHEEAEDVAEETAVAIWMRRARWKWHGRESHPHLRRKGASIRRFGLPVFGSGHGRGRCSRLPGRGVSELQ